MTMRFPVFYNSGLAKVLLFTGYSAIMLFAMIFSKKDEGYFNLNSYLRENHQKFLKHEFTHCKQWIECTVLGLAFILLVLLLVDANGWSYLWLVASVLWYYIQYLLEWVVSFIHHFFEKSKKDIGEANHKAYVASAMEMEAVFYEEKSWEEVDSRKLFSFNFFKFYGKI